ncbi:hypothetical protein ACLBR5_18400 [Escherichia coli]
MDLLRKLNYTKAEGPAKGQPMLNTAIDAAEMIRTYRTEWSGSRESLGCRGEFTVVTHTHLALNKEDEKIASAIFRTAAKSSPARPGLAWNMNTF